MKIFKTKTMQRFTILGIPALVDHGVKYREALRLLRNAEQVGVKLPAKGVEVRKDGDRLTWAPCKVSPIPDAWEAEKEPKLYIK